jgi:hypothetical protein
VFSPIGFQEFDAQKYRDFVRTLSDEALIKEGSKCGGSPAMKKAFRRHRARLMSS